jgi:hypothetical protein
MTTAQISRLFRARRSGSWKGKPSFMAKCPSHPDRMASLSITEGADGKTFLHCFRGCTVEEILRAKGLRMGDLFAESRTVTPIMRGRWADEERLETLERRHGLFIMLQAVEPVKRNYWRAAERNTAVEILELRRILYPVEEYYRRRNEQTQHIIAEYGISELMECVSCQVKIRKSFQTL